MSDKRISQLVARVTLANNDVFPIVASGAATTNKVTLQTIDDYMQTNLDFGVTSVAMSVPTGLSVTGTPITSTGTFVVTFTAGYSIPTNAKQTQWDTAYTNRITSATAPLGIASNVISITQSGAASNGYLSSTDWNTFNNKQATITTGNLTESTSSVLTITGGTSSVLGSGTTIQVTQASGSQDGFLDSADWTIFNGKQNALSGTGIVKSTGGTISYLTDSTSNWDSAYNDKINSAAVTGTTTKTLTLTQQDGGTITANWTDLDTGTVTSVGVSMPSAFSVVGSPITSSGTITITGSGLVSQYIDGTGALQTFPSGLPPTGAAGGDLSGTYPNPNVHRIHGIDMQSGTPTANDVWVYGGSPAKWQHQMLHSNQVTEDGNLFYTDARSRAAFSESVTGLDYNSTTGVLSTATGYSIPSTASQTNWTAAYDDTILSAAVTGTTTKTLTLTQRDSGTITASWTDINTDAVTSVFGRTGAVVATSGDYTTAQVTESGSLYFTDSRARLALSFVAGSGAYNSTTGVITIPTNNTQITNGSNYITLTSLSASTGISYNSTTGAISSTITQYTDALARAAISLTTTGTSGAATYTAGVLNIPNYSTDLSGYVTLGTTQTITGQKTISRASSIYNGTNQSFLIDGGAGQAAITLNAQTTNYAYQTFAQNGVSKFEIGIVGSGGNGSYYINSNVQVGETGASIFIKKSNGFVGINSIDPVYLFSVSHASDIWHMGVGNIGGTGHNLRIGGAAMSGATKYSTLGAYINSTDNIGSLLVLQRDGGNVIVGGSSVVSDSGHLFQVKGTGAFTGALSGTSAIFSGQLQANSIYYDESGVRSWTISKSSGNLLFASGDNAGAFKFTSQVVISNGNSIPLSLEGTTNQYLHISSNGAFEAMTRYTNPTAGSWYTGIRTNAGLGTTASYHIYSSTLADDAFVLNTNGTGKFAAGVTATSFVKTGGTGSQYLMADGSVSSGSGGAYLPLAGGVVTGNVQFTSTQPLTFTAGSNTGTYNQTAIYFNQNNTSGSDANGIFIERGRLTDSAAAETRYFTIGNRGGVIQWKLSGSGYSFQTDTCEVKPSADADLFVGRFSAGSAKLFRAYQSGSDGYLELQTGAGTIITKLSGYTGVVGYTLAPFAIGQSTQSSGAPLSVFGATIAANFATNQNGAGSGLCAYFVNNNATGYSSFIYIGSGPGTDWKIGKNISNPTGATYNFEIVDSSNNLRMQIAQATGNVTFSADVIAYSDIRLKKNIRSIDNALERVMKTRGVMYDRIDTEETNTFGFIAQELETIFPELVTTNQNGIKGVKYQNAVAVLFEAVKNQQDQINDLKKQIA